MELTEEIVLDVIEDRMIDDWPPAECGNSTISVKVLGDRHVCFDYNGTLEPRHGDDSYPKWYGEIQGNRFYLLSISIPPSMRNQGHGSSLYSVIERIAASLGCSEIRQTPSGWTPRGETRRAYLNRRGWLNDDVGQIEVFKPLSK